MPNCVAFGCEFKDEDNAIHGNNENIKIDSLLKSTEIFAKAIYDLIKEQKFLFFFYTKKLIFKDKLINSMVRPTGLEPARHKPQVPQTYVYTNFTTAATTYYNLPYFLIKNKTPIVASSFFQDHLSYMVYFDIHNN